MQILFIFFALLAVSPVFGAGQNVKDPALSEKSIEGYQQNFLLPIDVIETTKYNLNVTIPKGYKSVQPLSSFTGANDIMIEYIPQANETNNWSEIITVNKYIGQKASAKLFTSMLKIQMMSQANGVKLLKDTASNENNKEQAFFIMRYTFQGKHEVIGAKYYSGPFDSAGVQYTIRVRDGISQEDAIKKIIDYLDKNVKLIET